jgi:hypothetical protein
MGHVTRQRFGKNTDTLNLLFEFAAKVGRCNNGWEVAYFMQAFYDNVYGLSDKMYLENYERKEVNNFNRPLSMVSMNSREGLSEFSGYRRRLVEYMSFKVKDNTGMSFLEWINLPTFILEQLLGDLRLQFQEREAEAERQKQAMLDQANMGGAKDPHTLAMEQLAGGSKYRA